MKRDPLTLARATFRNAAALSFVGLLAKAMGLVVAVLVARYLGPAGLGLFALLLGLSLIAEQFGAFGVPDVALRAVGSNRVNAAPYWRAGRRLVLRISAAPSAAFIAAALTFRHDPHLALSLLLTAACVPLTAVGNVGQSVLQGIEQVGFVTWVNLASRIASLILLALLLESGGGVEAAFIARVAFQGGITAAYLARLSRLAGPATVTPVARSLLKSALPFAGSRALGELTSRLPMLVVSAFLGLVATGLYDAADRVSQILQVVIGTGLTALLPVFSHSVAHAEASRDVYVRNALKFTVLMIGMAGATLTAIGFEVITVLYGHEYAASASILGLLFGAQVLIAGDAVVRQAIYAHGREQAAMWTSAATIVVLLVLTLVMSALAGTSGVAGAVLIASATGLGINVGLARRCGVELAARTALLKPLAACLPSFLLAGMINHWPWPARVGAIVAVFAVSCGALRVFHVDELRFIVRALAAGGRESRLD